MSNLEDRVRALRDEVDLLREQNRQLKAALTEATPLPLEWKLSPGQAAMFGAMVSRPIVKTQTFITVLYGDHDDVPDVDIIKVLVHGLRHRLKPFGITIGNLKGQGYFLPNDVRARFKLRSAA